MIFWQHSRASRLTSRLSDSINFMTCSFTAKSATFFLPSGCKTANSPISWQATACVNSLSISSKAQSFLTTPNSLCSKLVDVLAPELVGMQVAPLEVSSVNFFFILLETADRAYLHGNQLRNLADIIVDLRVAPLLELQL